MSDTNANLDPNDPNAAGSDAEHDIRKLRQAADDGKAARREADEAKRELAFLRAGVDTESPIGKMFTKAYDGELDVELIKTAWTEVAPAAAPPPPPPQAQLTPEQLAAGFQDPAGQQNHRDGVFGNGTPTGAAEPQGKHPVDAAFEAFHAGAAQGKTLQERQNEALAIFFKAAQDGDQRVMFDPNAWKQRQIEGSMMDIAAPGQ